MGPLLAMPAPVAFAANGQAGFAQQANTTPPPAAVGHPAPVAHPVNVWVPGPGAPANNQYFCHGHSLGTFAAHGYSVFSGPDLQTVLQDEWNLVGSLHNGQAGDIVVWYNVHPGAPARLADHSALFVNVVVGANQQVDLNNTILSSKNGNQALTPAISLANLIATYGNAYALFRHK
jgi:hypothetical protein